MAVRVRVTERDLKVLLGCYENLFLTFKQIKSRYFDGLSNGALYSRLSLLLRSGYLESVPVGGILDENSTVSVVYRIRRRAYDLLLIKHPDRVEKEIFQNKIQLAHVYHDYLLSEVILSLRKRKSDLVFKNTKVFQTKNGHQGKRPDAILVDQKRQRKTALEIELTRKSDRRYRDIVNEYRLSDEFDSVLYITKDEHLSEKIRQVIRGKTPEGFTPKSTDMFYFATVDDILSDSECQITNGKDHFFGKTFNLNNMKEVSWTS